jgi:hypothetical protein
MKNVKMGRRVEDLPHRVKKHGFVIIKLVHP